MDNRLEVAAADTARLQRGILRSRGIHHLLSVCIQGLHADSTTVHADVHRTCRADRCAPLCLALWHLLPTGGEPSHVRLDELKNVVPVDRRPRANTRVALRRLCGGAHLLAYPVFNLLTQGGEWRSYVRIVHVCAVLRNFTKQLLKRDAFHPVPGLGLFVRVPTSSSRRCDSNTF